LLILCRWQDRKLPERLLLLLLIIVRTANAAAVTVSARISSRSSKGRQPAVETAKLRSAELKKEQQKKQPHVDLRSMANDKE
jgi:hypothetical protein